MKKMILFICAVLLLSGCVKYEEIDLNAMLADKIENAQSAALSAPDQNKAFYSYYIPPSIGRMDSTEYGNVFNMDGNEFIMNLNTAGIINAAYYPDITVDNNIFRKQPAAYADGTYLDYQNRSHSFAVAVYELEDSFITVFSSDTVEFYGISNALTCVNFAEIMLLTARNTTVNTDAVLAYYSSKETEKIAGQKIELFESIAPESGRIEELFEDHKESTDSYGEEQQSGTEQNNDEDDTESTE